MENMKNVSKMSLAALRAWETRRKNAAGSSSLKNEKKKEKKEREVKVSGKAVVEGLKADEQKEMKALNGVELEKLAKDTQKHLDRKAKMDEAKNGKEQKSTIVGKIIRKAKIERFNGGVKVSGVQ